MSAVRVLTNFRIPCIVPCGSRRDLSESTALRPPSCCC